MNKGRFPRKAQMPRLWPFAFLTIIVLGYSNCSPSRMTYDESPSMISSSMVELGDICSQTEEEVFSQGYHNFFKTNCSTCHAGGSGKGYFAHPNIPTAFPWFQSIGFDKLSSMAVSDSHNFPYTGSQHIKEISGLRDQWRTFLIEKQQCKTNAGGSNGGAGNTGESSGNIATKEFVPSLITLKKTIPEVKGTSRTVNINGTQTPIVEYNVVSVAFNLDGELMSLVGEELPQLGGATLSFSITGFSSPSGSTGYVIQMPRLKAGSKSVEISGLHIQINGQPVRYTYTFQHVQKALYQGTEEMLSGGSLLALGPLLPNDQIAVTIGNLKVVEMSAPPAPPSVQFALASSTIQASELGYANPYKVAVSRIGDNSNPVTIGLSTVGDQNSPTVAKGLMGPGGKNRFNWDYRFLTPMSVTFLPGETTKHIEIIFSDDERDEPTKTLTLRLADPFGATLGSNSSMVITIPNYASPPDGTAPTFTQLMSTGGILEMHCTRCHNSIEKQGGYDMTDYQSMVDKGVIVPGDPISNNHKMFRRMNPDAPGSGSITPMPLDGYLPQELTIFVENWIKAGAKNN